ncbi:MAG: hypothetical protein PHT40_03530 [Patescibacteria group bacterium]|nr:hypothetical protein [Patescibacteria group bacterium]
MKNKPKILILFILCVLIILGLWFYSLKLNLNKPSDGKGKFDLNLGEIFSDIGDTFKNLPPPPKFSTSTTATDQAIDTLADKLKQLENTNTSIADWQIYKNEKYNFEFRYPKNYTLNDRSTTETITFDTEGPGWSLDLAITSEKLANKITELNKTQKQLGGKTYNDIDWIIFLQEGSTEIPGAWYTAVTQLNSKNIIKITLSRSGPEELFYQILSTFKFLK